MKYRQFNTDFWEDSYIIDLTSKERELFIYLFTNHRVNLSGVYELHDRTITSTLGCTLDELAELKLKLEKDGKYTFFENWIYINNFPEHNKYSSAPNIVKTFVKDFNAIPPKVSNYFFYKKNLTYCPPIENYSNVIVMVKVMVMVKEGTPYPRLEAKLKVSEDIDPNSIPEDLGAN